MNKQGLINMGSTLGPRVLRPSAFLLASDVKREGGKKQKTIREVKQTSEGNAGHGEISPGGG